MSKKNLKPVLTAPLAIAGQPSEALLATLKGAGSKITVARMAEAVRHVESTRGNFICEAVATGAMILAKKESLPHGDFQKFEAAVWKEVKGKVDAASTLTGAELSNFTRSLRVYRFCAQHFLADLEQNRFAPDGQDMAVNPPAVKPDEVLALDTLPQAKQVAVYGAIERFVAGRSLRRMMTDFRRAEVAADQEEAEEAERKRKKTKVPAGDAAGAGQLDFWVEIQRPLTEIATLCEADDTQKHATKEFWTNLATALEHQAKVARARAKETRA